MKNFSCTLFKLAMQNGDMEPDNEVNVWTKEIKAKGIVKAIKKLNSLHPSLGLDMQHVDKIDPYNYRVYVDSNSNYYKDTRGFDEGFDVGLVAVMVSQFIIKKGDEDFIAGEKMFYNDGEWEL